MNQEQTKTIKMMHNDQLEYLTCPRNAKYEECIEIALERFEIPHELRTSIKLTNGSSKVFEKYTFEYYNLLFPSPATIFYIEFENDGLETQQCEKREPFSRLNNKRRHCDENNEGVPVTKQNCFLGSLPEDNKIEEPKSKRSKSGQHRTKNLGVLKRTASRRLIRL